MSFFMNKNSQEAGKSTRTGHQEEKFILNTVNIMTSHGNEERFYDVYNKKTLLL